MAAARAVVAPLLEVLQRRRSAAGLVTFSDLLRRAERLLADSPGVRREVVAGIDHLLVDEFQDTDDVQCGLVEWLALTGKPAARPSLFIVGDPKQSIYAWRSADLAAYDAFVVRVVDAGGVTVDLVRNFRSVTPILDEVERLVAPVMREEKGIQPRFQRLEATGDRREVPGIDHPEWMTVEHWVTWPRGEEGVGPEKGSSSRTTSALEAGALAADIRRLHDQGVIEEWSDVAVLLRVTTAQEELLKAFREVGIPYEVARERDYYRQRWRGCRARIHRLLMRSTSASRRHGSRRPQGFSGATHSQTGRPPFRPRSKSSPSCGAHCARTHPTCSSKRSEPCGWPRSPRPSVISVVFGGRGSSASWTISRARW
ncbi:MAG: UvrD-helicase domain-containing protein [Acidobacteria bacterium]|nr:UvrD-helicase domain-containing protein [Candidatus Sulfomarinibacter sp. MAG AM2]